MNLTTGIINGLAQLQAAMPVIKKDASGYGYKYASLDNIVQTIVPLMNKFGLCYCQPVGGDGTNISVTTIIMHSDGGIISGTISAPLASGKAAKMSEIQGAGSVITYLRRYSLSSMLGLVTDEDTDGAPMVASAKIVEPQAVLREKIVATAKAKEFGIYICSQYGVGKIADLLDKDAIEAVAKFDDLYAEFLITAIPAANK